MSQQTMINGVDFTEIMCPAEVAKLFKVDPKTVTRWAEDGKLSTIRTPGNHRRFSRAEVEQVLLNGSMRREEDEMDAPRQPFDQPREADSTPDGHRTAESRGQLVALAERLRDQFDVELTGDGLVVRNRHRLGVVVTITCQRRPDDGDRWWFFASCGEPIAEIDRIPDTVIAIHGYLAGSRS